MAAGACWDGAGLLAVGSKFLHGDQLVGHDICELDGYLGAVGESISRGSRHIPHVFRFLSREIFLSVGGYSKS